MIKQYISSLKRNMTKGDATLELRLKKWMKQETIF